MINDAANYCTNIITCLPIGLTGVSVCRTVRNQNMPSMRWDADSDTDSDRDLQITVTDFSFCRKIIWGVTLLVQILYYFTTYFVVVLD